MAARVVRKNYIEYGGRKFHQRADPDAYELALAAMDVAPRGRAIDLAAGSGLTSARMAEMGFDVIAYDINCDQFVPTEIPIHKADLNAPLPEDDASASAVMALEVIEHLENPRGFLREIGRILRPGGVLVLSTPNIVSLPSKLRFLRRNEFELFLDLENRVRDPFCEEADGHISPLLPFLLRVFLKDAGLRTDHVTYTKKYGVRSSWFGRATILRATRA